MTRLFAIAALLGAIGCSTTPAVKAPLHDTFSHVGQSERVAALRYGQVSPTVKSQGDYGWFRFDGKAGDVVDVWARSTDGDAVVFLLDGADDVVAANDDSAEGRDAHLQVTLPASGTFYIAYREASYARASFTVSLAGARPALCQHGCG